jgi:hypothetical protein
MRRLLFLLPVLPVLWFATVPEVTVLPETISFSSVSDSASLQGHCREAATGPVENAVWSWTSRNPTVVSVAGSRSAVTLIPGQDGSAYVVGTCEGDSDSSLVTVSSAIPLATCFDAGAATITHTGLFAVNEVWDRRNHLDPNQIIDATNATWRKNAPEGGVANDMVRFGPGPGNCLHGGKVLGLWDKNTEPWGTYHSSNAFVVDGPDAIVEDVFCENFGDCVKMMGAIALPENWTVRRVYGKDLFDDCIENDWQRSGTIEDVLFEGCFTFLATRDRVNFPQTEHYDTITINKAIVWHRDIPSGGDAGRFWKIDIAEAVGGLYSPKIRITNSIVRMGDGNSDSRYCLNEAGIVIHSENNILVWTGTGDFGPCGPAPAGWTVLTGTEGTDFWDAAVTQWKADHPDVMTMGAD